MSPRPRARPRPRPRPRSRRVVTVGGGVGGLAASIRLAAMGHHVTLIERNRDVGGKLATLERDGFTFDLGPSLLTLPHVFDDLFAVAGTTLEAEVDLVRLDPQFRYQWGDDSVLKVPDGESAWNAALEAWSPGSSREWSAFAARSRRIWEITERTFLAGSMHSLPSLAGRLGSPRDLVGIDPLRTLAAAASSDFTDPRLRQMVGRYATYSGSSPFAVPATLACISHVEREYGAWYVSGGLGALREALVRVAKRAGVEILTGIEATAIHGDVRGRRGARRAGGGITGVAVSPPVDASGSRLSSDVLPADIVIANVDAAHLYRDLIPNRRRLRRIQRTKRSTSGFVMCVGVDGTTPDLAHHNVWFSGDDRAEFASLERGELAADPTVYACVSSVTDPTQAPPGAENWFILVNVPAGVAIDIPAMQDRVFAVLADRGVDLTTRARFVETLTPADIERRDRTSGGAIYGTSSDGRRAAFDRPSNVGPVPGLYLVGGSSHPGGGLPMVTTSARIVADLIANDVNPTDIDGSGR